MNRKPPGRLRALDRAWLQALARETATPPSDVRLRKPGVFPVVVLSSTLTCVTTEVL